MGEMFTDCSYSMLQGCESTTGMYCIFILQFRICTFRKLLLSNKKEMMQNRNGRSYVDSAGSGSCGLGLGGRSIFFYLFHLSRFMSFETHRILTIRMSVRPDIRLF